MVNYKWREYGSHLGYFSFIEENACRMRLGREGRAWEKPYKSETLYKSNSLFLFPYRLAVGLYFIIYQIFRSRAIGLNQEP